LCCCRCSARSHGLDSTRGRMRQASCSMRASPPPRACSPRSFMRTRRRRAAALPSWSPFPRRSAHAAQSLGHPCSALCRLRVGLRVVLLGLPPSLPSLRRGLPLFVQLPHRYYAAVRLLHCVLVRIAARRLRGPVYRFDRRSGGLSVLVHVVSRRARVFDHAAFRPGSRLCRLGRMLPSR